ncbi:MAG: sugar transferase [Candidatus Omnitrophota bacterium]|jgi:exopolysaccharide biosynthesis polyprenyl glycosylphosphotransferase
MYKDKKYIRISYFFVDILLIAISFYIPYCLKYNNSLIPKVLPYLKEAVFLFVLWGVVLVIFLQSRQLYSTDRSWTISREMWRVFVCVAASSVLAGLMVFILQMKLFSRLIFIDSFLLLFFNLSFWRAIKRIFIRYRISTGFYNLNVLIIGAGKVGLTLAQELEKRHYFGRKIVGFFDTHKTGNVAGYNILSGNIEELENLIQKYFIDEVYITIPSQRDLVSRIILIGKITNTSVRVLLDSDTSLFRGIDTVHIGFLNFVKEVNANFHKTDILAKRALDIVVSMVGIIILTPLFIIVGVLIKLDSPGPVFYKSERCGRKGKIFNFYKFRSMVADGDKQKDVLRENSDVPGPVFKMKNDPRVTSYGKFLRMYSLDELPQLLNVFKGDMSLVGPRPPLYNEVEKYDIWHMKRLSIKPGITCLWQVRGRSNLSFYKWVKWDLWYIDNWSFALDLQILYWTIPAVFKKRGAY